VLRLLKVINAFYHVEALVVLFARIRQPAPRRARLLAVSYEL
jgi:hypothetical protein